MERNGTEVRITDADGSIYAGNLLALDSLPARPASAGRPLAESEAVKETDRANSESALASRYSAAPPSSAYSFQVTGTNRTAKLKVVLVGSLSETNHLACVRGSVKIGARAGVPVEAVEQP